MRFTLKCVLKSLNKPIKVHYLMQGGRGILLAHHYNRNLPFVLNIAFHMFVEKNTIAKSVNGFIVEGVGTTILGYRIRFIEVRA